MTSIDNERSAVPRAGLRVLVADGHALHQAVARRLLEREGHRVSVAGDGATALRALEIIRFDVILVPAQLPDMPGADVARAVRIAERERGDVAALVIATCERPDGPEAAGCMEAGADAVVPRPVRLEDFKRAMQHSGERPPCDAMPVPALDVRQALDRAGGSEALLRDVGAACVASMPQHASAIADALAAGDARRLARAAHSVKGMVANFGADAAAQAARRLQDAAGAGDLERARDEWTTLSRRLDELVAALTATTEGVR